MNLELKEQITSLISGEVVDGQEDLSDYSHDASMFELRPQLVVFPRDADDIAKLTKFVSENKKSFPDLSLTIRSGGTDMSGGAINESIIVDVSRYMNKIGSVEGKSISTQPGAFYRDFEPKTLGHGMIMPSFPASREICTVGGMVANNSGGERSLQFGKTEDYINELEVILADGNKYTIRPLNKEELDAKMSQGDYEGNIYKQLFELIEKNYDAIMAARPKVSKDSTGYHLWNVWDREVGIFDLTKIFAGSQGTLGTITSINFKLVPNPQNPGTLVIFLKDIEGLGAIINDVMAHNPASFEAFDNHTLMLSFKLFPYFRKTLGWWKMIKLAFQLIPDALILMRGIPKMVMLVEFTGETAEDVAAKIHNLRQDLKEYNHEDHFEENETEAKSYKFRIMRRESFNLLRKKVKNKHTAPFIDDLVVPPEHLEEFLPKVRKIIKKYKLLATIAGHMGDGNFHIIPLMEIEKESERAKLEPAMREVNKLVLDYGGSLSGEHNDGLIRGPWLEDMYGPEIFEIFREVKNIFDAQNILNPKKKTDANWDYSFSHIRKSF